MLRKIEMTKRLVLTVLPPYIFLVIASTILSRSVNNDMRFILKPFWSITTILSSGHNKIWLVKEVALNIIMLLPVGLLAPVLFEKRRLAKTLFVGIVLSVTIELIQLITHRGFAEIDDIIYNSFGVLIGLGINITLKECISRLEND